MLFRILLAGFIASLPVLDCRSEGVFAGRHYSGKGDIAYLQLLDKARRMFEPDPELQNICMLYEPKWNGLVEGETWDAWWIQNSYGTTYSILPLLREPFITFLQNSHDLWFEQMGDGKRVGASAPFDWVAPDGALCDAARPGWIVYKQGDGRTAIHDWGMEFTAAGVLMQAELLLIGREAEAINHYLPLLERSAAFIESRRDPTNNLYLAGPAGNLLAPSYAGWQRPDGSFDKAYLTGLSVTWIAALDRMIELEKLAGRTELARRFERNRAEARRGLALLTTPEGYLIRSLDPDGTKHGVFGAERHGYFEASPNHDAVAFRVADDTLARSIFKKITAIAELRPHDFILPNYPSYDDMYEKPEGLWGYGTWVNGGHWSTCEARMILGYYRMADFESARRSMLRLLSFAERFRMDNPLTKCGSDVYQPNQPINLCYDTLGPSAAFMRGLFEYLYNADGVVLVPHIPAGIIELHQHDPARLGKSEVYLSTYGTGPITAVKVNGRTWKQFDAEGVTLPAERLPRVARVQIGLGKTKIPKLKKPPLRKPAFEEVPSDPRAVALSRFLEEARKAGIDSGVEVAHAQLALECFRTAENRIAGQKNGLIKTLPEPAHAAAAKAYENAAARLCEGLKSTLLSDSTDPARKRLREIWKAAF